MSYVEQDIGKRFGSLTTFLLQLDPTCFLENKQKQSDRKYNMFATAYHPYKYLLNPRTRNMRKINIYFLIFIINFCFFLI
jgi:hypothetical protein